MAKEKKEKHGKGIGFYLGFFLLLIIAAVLVIFVVMLFMPGTSILGLEYFSNSGTTRLEKTTDGVTDIDIAHPSFQNVEVNCGYGEVVIQKSTDYKQNGIYIINEAKGFVTSKNATDFKLDVSLDSLTNTLKINVQEPNGFLYFSKNIQVVFNLADKNLDSYSNLNFKISTTNGTVNIGGSGSVGSIWDINIKSLNVQTNDGNILMSSTAPKQLTNLELQTKSGDIIFAPENVQAGSMSLATESGKITVSSLGSVAANSPIKLSLNNGTFRSTGIIYQPLHAQIKDAYIDINEAKQGVRFLNSPFNSGVVNIKKVHASSVNDWAVDAPNGLDTDFNIALGEDGYLEGKLNIVTTTGSIKVGGEVDSSSNLCSDTGSIEAKLSNKSASVVVTTQTGKLYLTLPNEVNNLLISNKSGETYLTTKKSGSYKFEFYQHDSIGQPTDLDLFNLSKVHLNYEGQEISNPFNYGSTSSSKLITVKTNGTVNFNWV